MSLKGFLVRLSRVPLWLEERCGMWVLPVRHSVEHQRAPEGAHVEHARGESA